MEQLVERELAGETEVLRENNAARIDIRVA
jgi:hypothetical protein